ncbi:MAG TPA: hypothetical protein VIV11_41295 [Kofleriaceae bacterium]
MRSRAGEDHPQQRDECKPKPCAISEHSDVCGALVINSYAFSTGTAGNDGLDQGPELDRANLQIQG